jgi:vacuolar-type H+-ATPase subunit H
MRSVIEEIAAAEQQAEEIRQNAAVQARELTLKAKDDAQQALSKLESDARASLHAELETAKLQGERLSADLLARLEQDADAVCGAAEAKLDQAVAYLLDKVTKTA